MRYCFSGHGIETGSVGAFMRDILFLALTELTI
jgi:hypothetical protein